MVDPCVFYKWSDELPRALKLVIGCHVDDSIIAGKNPYIDKHMDAFENYLKIERLGTFGSVVEFQKRRERNVSRRFHGKDEKR